MADKEHLEILKKGVKAWNKWREDNPNIRPNLSHANLTRQHLRGINLDHTNAMGAKFNGAELTAATFSGTQLISSKLSGANLSGTNLTLTNFGDADLRESDLTHATIVLSNFNSTNLDQANLRGTILGLTMFGNVDLSNVRALEAVEHLSPCTIGADTLYRSKGKIPEAFLRGCGLSDDMIEFARSIAGSPIEFNSCFISYSTKDEEFAKRLHSDLQSNAVRCWFAAHDMKGGKKLHEQIDWAIHYHDRVLLLLSPDSINSEWVKREIDKARKKEADENRDVLFPLSLVKYKELEKWEYIDSTTGKDVAQEIRSFYIPDFSNWKDHDSYQDAFKKLLQDLKGERTKAAP